AGELRRYFADAIEYRRRQPGEDLISALIAANAEGTLTDDELLASCVILLVAGNETTTKLIANSVLALATHPDQRDRLAADLGATLARLETRIALSGLLRRFPRFDVVEGTAEWSPSFFLRGLSRLEIVA